MTTYTIANTVHFEIPLIDRLYIEFPEYQITFLSPSEVLEKNNGLPIEQQYDAYLFLKSNKPIVNLLAEFDVKSVDKTHFCVCVHLIQDDLSLNTKIHEFFDTLSKL